MTGPQPPTDIRLAELEHELANARTLEHMTARRRAHIHMVWLSLGAILATVLYIVGKDMASIVSGAVSPVLAEVTVLLRKLD